MWWTNHKGIHFSWLDGLQPPVFVCLFVLFLFFAGGKWLCLFHKNVSKNPTVISIGSNGDSSFEEDVNRRLNAFSHTFDFTLNATDKAYISSRPYLKFYDLGLAGKTMVPITYKRFKRWFPKMRVVTVPQMLAATGLKYVDYFKIDCEVLYTRRAL